MTQMRRPTIHDLLMGEFKFRPIGTAHHQTPPHSGPRKPYRTIGKKAEQTSATKTTAHADIKGSTFHYLDGKPI